MLRKVSLLSLFYTTMCNCFPVVSSLRTPIPLQWRFYSACLSGEQSSVALPGLGGPLLATPGPCSCHTLGRSHHPAPALLLACQQLTAHMREIKQDVQSICFGLNKASSCFMWKHFVQWHAKYNLQGEALFVTNQCIAACWIQQAGSNSR